MFLFIVTNVIVVLTGACSAASRPQPDVLAMQDVQEQGNDTQQQITNEGSTTSLLVLVYSSVASVEQMPFPRSTRD